MDKSDLLARIREGDHATLRELYRALRADFIRWAQTSYGFDEDTAKEVFQDSIVAAYDNAATGKLTELRSSFKTYLYSIGKHKALEQKRKEVMVRYAADEDLMTWARIRKSGEVAPDEEEITRLKHALDQLGDPCRKLLELMYYKRLDQKSIAQIMGYRNRDTVKTKKYKCLMRLRRLFHKTD